MGEKNLVTKKAGKYTQERYAVVVCAIKSERIVLQRVVKDTEQVF